MDYQQRPVKKKKYGKQIIHTLAVEQIVVLIFNLVTASYVNELEVYEPKHDNGIMYTR